MWSYGVREIGKGKIRFARTIWDKYLCNYMNDIVFCGWPHIKIMNNGSVCVFFSMQKLAYVRSGVDNK